MLPWITKKNIISYIIQSTQERYILDYILNYFKSNGIYAINYEFNKYVFDVEELNKEQVNELFMLLCSD